VKVYIDSSVISGLLADDVPDIKEKTRRFFQRVKEGEFHVYISSFVVNEIEATPDLDRREKLLHILEVYPFRELGATEEAVQLADEYIRKRVIPSKSRMDGLHIAMASVHGIEALASWNFKHIV